MKSNIFPEGIKFLFVFYFLNLFFVFPVWGQGTWIQRNNFPMMSRESAIAFELNGKGYFGTGHHNLGMNDFWEYDPAADSWTQKADASAILRDGCSSFVINNKGYIALGNGYFPIRYLNDLIEYDPLLNQWNPKQDFPGWSRAGAVAFSINTMAYIGLGDSAGIVFNDWWQYNTINDSWNQISSFPGIPVGEASAFAIGNMGYVVSSDTAGFKGYLWAYDPSIDLWTQKSFIPDTTRGRRSAVSFIIGQVAYIGTGFGKPENLSGCTRYKNDFWQYNPNADQWIQVDSIPIRRDRACGISINGKGYVFGGFNNCSNPQFLNDVWEYTPDTTVFAGVGNTEKGINISVYPNPFSNRIIVNGIESTGFNCSLFDLKGSKVSVVRSGKSIQTKDVKPGIYFLKISYKEKEYFFKVMKKSKD